MFKGFKAAPPDPCADQVESEVKASTSARLGGAATQNTVPPGS